MEIRNEQTSEIFGIVQQNIRQYLIRRRLEEQLSFRQLSEKSGVAEEVLVRLITPTIMVCNSGREISVGCLLKILDFYRRISA